MYPLALLSFQSQRFGLLIFFTIFIHRIHVNCNIQEKRSTFWGMKMMMMMAVAERCNNLEERQRPTLPQNITIAPSLLKALRCFTCVPRS